MGRGSFKASAYARLADGSLLNPRYSIVTNVAKDSNNYIQVVLSADADTRSQSSAHAVYVKVTDAVNPKATNVFCFMVTNTSNEDFCRSICQENLLYESPSQRPESLDFFISGSGSNTAVTYSDNFSLMT